MKMRTFLLVGALLGLAGCALFGPEGPSVADELAQQRQQIDSLQAEQQQKIQEASTVLTQGQITGTATQAEVQAAEETLKVAKETQARLQKLEDFYVKVQSSFNPDGSLNGAGAGAAIAGVVPGPWQPFVLLGAPLVVGLIQQWRKKQADQQTAEALRAGRSIINGIDALRLSEPAVKEAMKKHESLLMSNYSPLAQALVKDETITPRPVAA